MKKTIIIITLLVGSYILVNNGLLNNKQTKGSFTASNGTIVDGIFKDNKLISGSVTYPSPNGEKHIGKFSNNVLHGEGMIVLSDGSKYQGVFENGKIKGLGVNTFNAGNINYIYIGGLNSGDMAREGNGISILNIQSGENYALIYIGDFKDHKKNGFGSYFIGKASTYVGEFKDDKEGKGTIIID